MKEKVLASFEKICESKTEKQNIIQIGSIEIDILQHKVFCQSKALSLTEMEFQLFIYLAKQPGRVFTKEQIYRILWNEEPDNIDNAVMCLISGIRKKLKVYTDKQYIQTVRGIGYKFVIPEE